MDKEAREKIEAELKRLFWEYGVKVSVPLGLESPDREAYVRPIWADRILALIPELHEGEPPLLSDEEIKNAKN